MKSIALTGSKFSGKSRVAEEFGEIGIPTFDGDVAIKFLLNYDNHIRNIIIDKMGKNSYLGYRINTSILNKPSDIYQIISYTEMKVFDLYYKWKKRQKSDYVLFMSSVIYEQNLAKNFDKVISVYAPFDDRIQRLEKFKYSIDLDKEYNPILKNEKSDFIIHNYDSHDIKKQVINIHNQICNKELVI